MQQTSDGASVRTETGRRLHGHDGALAFWEEDLAQFNRVESTFSRVCDGEVGVLAGLDEPLGWTVQPPVDAPDQGAGPARALTG